MPTPYPRKQTLVTFVVCVAIVAAVTFYARGQAIGQAANDQQLSVSAQDQQQVDALAAATSTDWRKSFFGVASSSISLEGSGSDVSSSTDENLTATQQFSQDVFTQIINLKEAGLVDNGDVVSTTVSDLLEKNYSSSDQPRVYTMGDIIISPDNSTTALRAYGNIIGSLLKTYSPKQEDASIALAGMQGKDPSYAEELAANAAAYNTILSHLLTIPAPQSLSTYHLGLVNSASRMAYIASAFSVAGTDPMQAIDGLSMYQTTYPAALENIGSIQGVLIDAGITYDSSEGGSFLLPPKQ